MNEKDQNELEQVEEWAARLAKMSQEMFLGSNPTGNLGILTGALCVASGRLLQAYCPEEEQPEGAAILVDFLRHGILTQNPRPNPDGERKILLPH